MAKILIIEDEEVLYQMYQQLLQNHGHKVFVGKTGEKGLKLALEEHPDLILLDIRLPKMDGMAMLKLLRQDTWGTNVPVIILTNLDANDEILKGVMEDHPSYYLIKSNVDHNQVLERITSVLEGTRQK